jgi:hypothetical protein
MASNEIKVFIKIRPLIHRERNENANSVWSLAGNTLKSTDKQYELTFGKLQTLIRHDNHVITRHVESDLENNVELQHIEEKKNSKQWNYL